MKSVILYPKDKILERIEKFYKDNKEVFKVLGEEAIDYIDEITEDMIDCMCDVVKLINEENGYGN